MEEPIFTLAFEVIRAIPGRRFFALSTEELILELAILTAKIFDLGFEVLGPMHGPSVLSLPISDLLPQFEVLTPQIGDFLAQLGNFATKLPHQFGQISRLGGRKWVDKRVFHDRNACNPDLPSMKRSIIPIETGWAKLYYPTRANFVSWIARIFSLKNSMSRNPYAWRFIVLILLFVPSIGPLEIITS